MNTKTDFLKFKKQNKTNPEHTELNITDPFRHSNTWVRNHNDDAIRAVLDDLRNNEFEDINVPLHQVETTLSLLLANSSSYHHNLRIGGHRVV